MKNTVIGKLVRVIAFFILFGTLNNCKAQNQSNLILNTSESGIQLHTACQSITLSSNYSYNANEGAYMLSSIDNTNMCNVSYISGAGFDGNTPPPLNNNCAVGTINGSFNVNTNGAATYTIPLVIPPGTMGMVPNLTLNYNSQGNNGILGTGWSLGGLSAITRTTENYYNDGGTLPVTLSNDDRFLLDGNRLILAFDDYFDYGGEGMIYHTENETFQQVQSWDEGTGSPVYFTVETKDGKTLQYGYTTDSRIMACGSTTQVLTWLLNSVTDNRGNYMNIHYVQDNINCQYYPDYIEYTGNNNSSPVIPPYNKVTFSYALRADPQTAYVAGYPVNQNVLLTGIQMYAQNNTLMHHYALSYSMDALYSHLSEITEYGSDGSSYNSTKINYHTNLSQSQTVNEVTPSGTLPAPSRVLQSYGSGDPEGGLGPDELMVGDVDGDGRTDLVDVENQYNFNIAGCSISSTGSGSSLCETFPFENYPDGNTNNGYFMGINYSTYLSTGNNSSFSFGLSNSGSNDNAIIFNYGGQLNVQNYFNAGVAIQTGIPSLMDVNGDGLDDMFIYGNQFISAPEIYPDGYCAKVPEYQDEYFLYLSNGSLGFQPPITFLAGQSLNCFAYQAHPVNAQTTNGNFLGMGMQDFVAYYKGTQTIYMFSLKLSGSPPTYAAVTNTYNLNNYLQSSDQYVSPYTSGDPWQNAIFPIDINGDGRTELLLTTQNYVYILDLNSDNSISVLNYFSNSTYFGTNPAQASIYPGDFNGDGKTDLLIYNNQAWSSNHGSSNNWHMAISNGLNGFTFFPASNFMADNGPSYGYPYLSPNSNVHNYYVADFNGDGIDDIVDQEYTGTSGGNKTIGSGAYQTYSTMNLTVDYGTGNLSNSGQNAFVQKTFTQSLTNSIGPVNSTVVGDFDGDGHSDLLYWGGNYEQNLIFNFDYNTQPDNGINKAIAISNGLNATTNITYNSLPYLANETGASTYASASGNIFPLQFVSWPIYVTQSTQQDNGLGTQNETDYSYAEALNYTQGKGFLGFGSMESIDNSKDLAVTNTYEFYNAFYDKLPLSTASFSYSTGYPIDSKTYQYTTIDNPTTIPGTSDNFNYYEDIHYNYLSQKVENNELYSTSSSTTTYTVDVNGNPVETDINSSALSKQIYYDYYITHPNIGWNGAIPACLDDYSSNTQRITDINPYYRYSTIYYNDYGQPIEKDDDIPLITLYTYDDAGANLGNMISTRLIGDFGIRTNTVNYDTYGRFIIQNTNNLGQITYSTYDNAYGNPLTTTDLNGHTKQYTFDGFGRIQQVITPIIIPPSNQITTITRGWDNSNGPSNSLYYMQLSAPGLATQTNYYDVLGKVLRTQKNGFGDASIASGTNINIDMSYYPDQQLESKTEPYYDGTFPQYNTFSYDDFQRPSAIIDAAGLTAAYTYAYGQPTYTLITSGTSPTPVKTFSKTFDVTGKLIQASDDGGDVAYTYASCGKANSITVRGLRQPYTFSYDTYGRLSSKFDPDLGTTTYTYDDLNEVTNIIDPTSHYSQSYDALGRVKTSNESVSGETNTYTYDLPEGIGLLGSVVGVTPANNLQVAQGNLNPNTVTYTYAYDLYSRVQSITENILGTSYVTNYLYDNLNRVTQIEYPNSFFVDQYYNNYGYLYQVSSGSGYLSSSPIWNCTGMNAYDEVESTLEGGGGTVNKNYDNLGYLQNIIAEEPGVGDVMAFSYSFNDQTGNLNSRTDDLTGNLESFSYDNLDRLLGTTNINFGWTDLFMSYGSGGVLTTKSDVGNYGYNSTPAHAVAAITSPSTNIPQDIQQSVNNVPSLSYTPFKKISTIQEGPTGNEDASEMDYIYGPDHQRRQSVLSSNGVTQQTVNYFGNYENITNSTDNYDVNYITSPSGLVAMNVNDNNSGDQLYYVHTDHLGSIINLYNSTLNYTQSFDAWGNYRNTINWGYLPSSTISSDYSPNQPPWLIRGYIAHEQLNPFGLIDMNGRVYDPLIAQMLSPDPVVQFPSSSQGFQRYAYCSNNPLKYTDPTGYDDDDDDDGDDNYDDGSGNSFEDYGGNGSNNMNSQYESIILGDEANSNSGSSVSGSGSSGSGTEPSGWDEDDGLFIKLYGPKGYHKVLNWGAIGDWISGAAQNVGNFIAGGDGGDDDDNGAEHSGDNISNGTDANVESFKMSVETMGGLGGQPDLSKGNYVALVNAPNGAEHMGHNALLIGNNTNGWQFYSKEGRDHGQDGNSSSGGPSLNINGEVTYGTIQDLFNARPEYTQAAVFAVTPSQVLTVKSAMSCSIKSSYNFLVSNCGESCASALASIGLIVNNPFDAGIEQIIPNASYGTIVYWNSDKLTSLIFK